MTIKTLLFAFISITLVVFGTEFVAHVPVFAETSVPEYWLPRVGGEGDEEEEEEDADSQRLSELEKEIAELEGKVADLQNQGASLQKEIDSLDSQIALTELRIEQSIAQIAKKEREIAKLGADIDDLKLRIDKLKDSISYQADVLAERMRSRYKARESSPVVVLFGSTTVNTLIQKTKYLEVMEHQDLKLLDEMNATKDAYGTQKTLFEDKKDEEQTLKAQLEVEKTNLETYEADLETKKSEKRNLLEKTQNDEAKYQQQLEEAQRELNQMLSAVSVLIGTEPKDVEKGEVIGLQGNTGYSFGEHLHFGVYRYGSFEDISGWNWYYANYVDPSKKLKEKQVYWNDGCSGAGNRDVGDGDWKWPIDNPTISQGFGHTCWSYLYGGNVHPAYDMYGSTGAPVYAVDDGRAYFCRNCLGDGGNGVFIFHDDDYMTVYWHLR